MSFYKYWMFLVITYMYSNSGEEAKKKVFLYTLGAEEGM